MNIQNIFPSLLVETPKVILDKIIAHNAIDNQQNKATVSLNLSSSVYIEGTPIKINTENNILVIISDEEISYVQMAQIDCIRINNFTRFVDLLTDDTYFEVKDELVPTPLELKRKQREIEEFLESTFGVKLVNTALEEIKESKIEKYQMQEFFSSLLQSIKNIGGYKNGKEALEMVSVLTIASTNNKLNVKKNTEGNLELEVNFKQKFETNFREQLENRLEENL
ncbi:MULTISPECIES: hypothetical protein [unclassified Cellulophaga]|uniref:hypothetical protein n=1 Tax=unclassified Cellulophaga TaxID=2634405 RepID=UPI0026E32B61|nr:MULTISPECIES: hypothetical protein [unclassified Cellulophaga]MDO6492171.1 hypothetical protein [Cellulophaga sp. 2_MG-2023]MDO6495668.1 hypothetical protein [Cellulophaga sp. 3_MG-2023]